MRVVIPLAGVAIAAWASGSCAQPASADPPSEQVQVTATRVTTSADDIAAGVTVIDRATVAQRGYTTLADALSAVAGVQLVQSGGPGANASLFVRGANSNQVQVLVDGVPVNDVAGPGGAFNFGEDTLADVARIEVVRGPLSAVYGSGAIGGVVNIITQRGTGAPTGTLTLAAGLPRALLGTLDLRGASGRVDWAISAESRSDRGFDATPEREHGYTGERDGFRSRTGTLTVGATPVDGTRVFVQLRGRTSVSGYDDVGFPAFDDPNETARDNDARGLLGVTSTLLGGAWHTGLTVSRDQEYRRYVNRLDTDDPNGAAEDSRYLGRRTTVQWNNTVRLPDLGPLRAATLTAGYEHTAEVARQALDSAYFGFPYVATVHAAQHRDAGYAGYQASVARVLAISANLRGEQVGGGASAVTWRIGGSYALPFLASHLKASVGTAFLAPSLFDRFGVDSGGYVGNPALRPERSRGYEVGWAAPLAGGAAVLGVTWFHTHVGQLIETEFVPAYTSVNVAAARLQGVEATLSLRGPAWISAELTYSYTDARNLVTGSQLPRRPYDAGSATVVISPGHGVQIVPQVTWAGGAQDALVDDAGYYAGLGRRGGGAMLNLNGSWQASPRVRLFAWGRNLNSSRAEAASGFAPPGPSFLAGVRLGG